MLLELFPFVILNNAMAFVYSVYSFQLTVSGSTGCNGLDVRVLHAGQVPEQDNVYV